MSQSERGRFISRASESTSRRLQRVHDRLSRVVVSPDWSKRFTGYASGHKVCDAAVLSKHVLLVNKLGRNGSRIPRQREVKDTGNKKRRFAGPYNDHPQIKLRKRLALRHLFQAVSVDDTVRPGAMQWYLMTSDDYLIKVDADLANAITEVFGGRHRWQGDLTLCYEFCETFSLFDVRITDGAIEHFTLKRSTPIRSALWFAEMGGRTAKWMLPIWPTMTLVSRFRGERLHIKARRNEVEQISEKLGAVWHGN